MSWRYDPAESKRDLRLDLLRGLCLAKMILTHVWYTPLQRVQDLIGFVTAAEGFFFISGVVVGIVHGRRMHEHGLGQTSRTVLQRALNLYLANLAFVLLFTAMSAVGLVYHEFYSNLWTTGQLRWSLLFTFNQPFYLHVLPRYVAFLALTPVALWLLKSKRTHWLLLLSGGAWGLYHLLGRDLLVPVLETEGVVVVWFPIVAWQLLFFVGMCVGYHRRSIGEWWQRLSPRWSLAVLIAAALGFAVLKLNCGRLGIPWWWFDRIHLPPIRIVNLAVVFTLLFLLTDRFWGLLRRLVGPVLLPFGQDSLYLFLIHMPIVLFGRAAVSALHLGTQLGLWRNLLLDVLVYALVWLMIRKRVLFGFLPR